MDLLDNDKLSLLLNIGYAGCSTGKVYQARKIFVNLASIYPECMPIKIGLAFSYIVVDDFVKGEDILHEVIEADDSNDDAKALLAFSYALQKKEDEALAIINAISEDSTSAYNLAQSAKELLLAP